jgi:uncharacterized protein YybS (DUF2232 family)
VYIRVYIYICVCVCVCVCVYVCVCVCMRITGRFTLQVPRVTEQYCCGLHQCTVLRYISLRVLSFLERCAFLLVCDVAQIGFLPLEDWTYRFFRNGGKELPLLAA